MFKAPVERLQTYRRDESLKGCFAARREALTEVLARRIDRILADGFSRGGSRVRSSRQIAAASGR